MKTTFGIASLPTALACAALALHAQPLAKPLAEFDKLVADLKAGSTVSEPIRAGDTTVVPFAAVHFALGSVGAVMGAGGGMGEKTTPLGVVIVEGDDVRIDMLPQREEKRTSLMQQLLQNIIDQKVAFMVNGLNVGNATGSTADLASMLAALQSRSTFMVNGLNLGNLNAPRPPAAGADKTTADVESAVRKSPTAENYFALGEALRKGGQKEKAAEAYREALKLRPNYPEAARALATLKE